MRAALRIATLAALVVTHASAQSSTQAPPVQAPPRDATAAAAPTRLITGTGFIGGVVTDESGSRRCATAYVVLIGIGTGVVKVSSTDAEGRFGFAQLPVDSFTIGASKPPFLGSVAGARRPARPGSPVVLTANQRLTNVAIRMPMGAAITGTVTTESGEPAADVQVAVQRWQMQAGARTLVSIGRLAGTDERGRYRIYGLPPGEYIVGALSQPRSAFPQLTTAEVDAVLRGEAPPAGTPVAAAARPPIPFAPVYAPGTPRIADAATILLGPGEERPNADIRLQNVPSSRITAQVMTTDGQSLPGPITVVLRTTTGLMQRVWNARSSPDGQVTFNDIPPGLYAMVATTGGAANPQVAHANVEVSGSDVFGVELALRPAPTIAANVGFRGTAAYPSPANLRIPVRSLDPNSSQNPNVTLTSTSGDFSISSILPGRYIVGGPLSFGPTTDTMAWALESVVVDGKDMTDLPIVVGGDATPKSIMLTYTDVFQELTGRITRSGGQPVSDYTIVIFPEDTAYWVWQSRRIVAARPGNDGRFTLSGRGLTTLPAGRYLLAAVADLDRDEQFDPAFLGAIAQSAISVVLRPGEKKIQDIVVK